jgi:hypothetical protein
MNTTLLPRGVVLLNVSLGSTNEREGSEIARQIVGALLDGGLKVYRRIFGAGAADGDRPIAAPATVLAGGREMRVTDAGQDR